MNTKECIERHVACANANRDQLEDLRRTTKDRLRTEKPGDGIRNLFEKVCFADLYAADLESRTPGLVWGFSPHDARFLRSLRDQQLGIGDFERRPKPLTTAQLAAIKVVLQREPYLSQVALLINS